MNFVIKKYQFNSQEVVLFAQNIAKNLKIGDIIFLEGELGTGKSFFIKELCHCFDGDENIETHSPTFSFYHLYDYKKLPIWHYDLYRLKNEISFEDLQDLDLEEAISNGIVLIEWANKLKYQLQKNHILIKISYELGNLEVRNYEVTSYN